MSIALSPATERLVQRLMDYGERLILSVLFAAFLIRIAPSLAGAPFNWALVASESLVVVFVLIRRPAAEVSTRPADWVFGMLGTLLPLLVKPGGAAMIGPPALTAFFMLVGLMISIWAKIALQRSFGIAAANRGVIESGPYRLVRHPMYAGYILVQVGFLLGNPSLWNLGVYGAALVFQVARILAEERLLSADPAYVELKKRVRFRLLPPVF